MTISLIRPVILCGGGGTRLWPLSTDLLPKQFLALSGGQSMLRETADRVADPARFSQPLAIGAARHADRLRAALPQAGLLLEPVGRNSAPAIAAACLMAAKDELLLVLPADHHIARADAFLSAIDAAVDSARAGRIVTFGIRPDRPATVYGYIEGAGGTGLQSALRFVEKPDAETARHFLETGRFYWNGGIFLFTAGAMLAAFERHAADILDRVRAALGTDGLDRALFKAVRAQSIDYAVMEHADNIDVIPVEMGWSDLGDFAALHALSASSSPNGVVCHGPAAVTQAKDVYVHSTGPLLAVHGVSGVAVTATRSGVLVTSLEGGADAKAAIAAARNPAAQVDKMLRTRLRTWLFEQILPAWAERSPDPRSGGFFEVLGANGHPVADRPLRGRVAPRQLFSYARAKALGWNPNGAADAVIEHALAFLEGPARSPRGGWAHALTPDGRIGDPARDFYDHTFVALAGAELSLLGDARGAALAAEAFELIDVLFADARHGGWLDAETGDGTRRANPHMHLLEAALAWHGASGDSAALARANTVATLFERHMFDPDTGAVNEVFAPDWRVPATRWTEPGHCYEWAYLLCELEQVCGRDTGSWQRRLVGFGEAYGLSDGLVVDVTGTGQATCRLWPQLERLRALLHVAPDAARPDDVLERIFSTYLDHGEAWVWRDQISPDGATLNAEAPSSMLYHFMTVLAPLATAPD